MTLLDDAALFLDFDGTLVELADSPESIRVPPALGGLLGRLSARLNGRVAILSGRALDNLTKHLPVGGMALAGSHGAELRLAHGCALPVALPPGIADVQARVRAFAEAHVGLLAEEKPAGVALHFRRRPEQAAAATALAEELARAAGLVVQKGKMVVELRPANVDKGEAVRRLMAQEAFAGARPVFIGDDLTDEHGFAAAAEAAGAGILVGPERETAARYRLASVTAVAAWLDAACAT